MSGLIQRNKSFIRLFCQGSPRQREALLLIATKDQFLSLVEITFNALRGSLPLDDTCIKKLKRKRSLFRSVAFDKSICWKTKRNLVVKNQAGGILGALAGAAASYLFKKVLDKIVGGSPPAAVAPPSRRRAAPAAAAPSLTDEAAGGEAGRLEEGEAI